MLRPDEITCCDQQLAATGSTTQATCMHRQDTWRPRTDARTSMWHLSGVRLPTQMAPVSRAKGATKTFGSRSHPWHGLSVSPLTSISDWCWAHDSQPNNARDNSGLFYYGVAAGQSSWPLGKLLGVSAPSTSSLWLVLHTRTHAVMQPRKEPRANSKLRSAVRILDRTCIASLSISPCDGRGLSAYQGG
jgi:hypothetical protein